MTISERARQARSENARRLNERKRAEKAARGSPASRPPAPDDDDALSMNEVEELIRRLVDTRFDERVSELKAGPGATVLQVAMLVLSLLGQTGVVPAVAHRLLARGEKNAPTASSERAPAESSDESGDPLASVFSTQLPA